MKRHRSPIALYILAILVVWSSCLCLYADTQDHQWQQQYKNYVEHDHQGNIDTMTVYSWKAFNLARQHQNDSLQVRAIGNLINALDMDSVKRYISILDTFPETPNQVYHHSQMLLTYYRMRLFDMSESETHQFLREMVQKADSVYADSADIHRDSTSESIYLLKNRLYLSVLIQAVSIDSDQSPYHEYLKRLIGIIEQLPAYYRNAKLNGLMTLTALSLGMQDYKNALKYSEAVIQGLLSTPGVPNNFQDMKMGHATVCYYMCYQQLQCYDDISPEILERNWAFMNSPYGQKCHNYIVSYGEGAMSFGLYYDMAKKRYNKVIEQTNKKIFKYKTQRESQIHFVNLQNVAISRVKNPEKYQNLMFRNYLLKKQFQEEYQKTKEIDYTNLYAINKLQKDIALKQLEKENTSAIWSVALFVGILFIAAFGIWGIYIMYKANKRKTEQIGKLKEATTRTAKKKLEAEHAKMVQTICLDNMNHEIRSPLNSIVGFSQLLLEDPELDQETKKQFADQINTSSAILLQIINDVLDAAQLESGQYKLQKEYLSVCRLCDYAIRSHQPKVQPGVSLTLDCKLGSCVEIYTDKTRLLQILLNFLSNACKHTPAGHIILSCDWADAEETHILFTVSDTGSGVPADMQPYLFERFAKLNNKAQGTGLGLNIAATLAHVMGAKIGYDSSYTDGAKFYLKIPKMNT